MSKMINFYDVMPKELLPKADNPNKPLHQIDLPFRMCIVAPSGSGKTNFLLNLIALFSKGRGTFASITILTRVADEPLYNFLKLKAENIQIKEGLSNTPPLDKFDKEENHLVIWDDLVLAKSLEMVENYYIRARKFNVSCIFISQSYYHIPTMIRKNCSYMVILKLGSGKREIKMIMSEFGMGLEQEQIMNMYEYATDTKFVPLLVDMNTADKYKKFRKGFLEILNPDEFLE
jgi:DNA helicase HerA-like ATPase